MADERESKLVLEFRDSVADVLQGDYEFTDHYLVKWLKRYKYDVKKSEVAFRKYKSWDIKMKLDEGIVLESSEFAQDLPIQYCGFDKVGCPVIFVQLGKWNVQKYADLKRKDELLFYAISTLESTLKIMKEQHFNTNGAVNHMVGIIDMDGFSLRSVFNRELIKSMVDMAQLMEAYYPDMGKSFHAVNIGAITIANILLKITSPFLDSETLDRIHIHGSNKSKWREALTNLVPDLEQYPQELRSQLCVL